MMGLEPTSFCMARTRREKQETTVAARPLGYSAHWTIPLRESQQPAEKPDEEPDYYVV
jgi:hypothetical protein